MKVRCRKNAKAEGGGEKEEVKTGLMGIGCIMRLSILSWNIRGLGSKGKKGVVGDIIRSKQISVLVIQETKMGQFSKRVASSLWGRKNFDFVHKEAVGCSGGILVAWDKKLMDVSEVHIDSCSISIKCFSPAISFAWMFSGVYGHVNNANRKVLWEELDKLQEEWMLPWYLAGDFNVVRFPSERSSEGRSSSYMRRFDDFISCHQLMDPPLEGAEFTWSNMQTRPTFSRLDKVLMSEDWEEQF